MAETQVRDWMHAGEIGNSRLWRLMGVEKPRDPRAEQLIVDGRQALRALRVIFAHVVLHAIGVGNEGDGHIRILEPIGAGSRGIQ